MFVHLVASQFCVRCLLGLSELQFVHRGGFGLWLFSVLFVVFCCVVFVFVVCCCGCSGVRMICIISFHVLFSCWIVSPSLSSVCAIMWAVSLLCCVFFVYSLLKVLVNQSLAYIWISVVVLVSWALGKFWW